MFGILYYVWDSSLMCGILLSFEIITTIVHPRTPCGGMKVKVVAPEILEILSRIPPSARPGDLYLTIPQTSAILGCGPTWDRDGCGPT